MKLAIMQPYLFPYIGYWQLMNAADIFVSYDDVNYINRGWINRNNILLNGQAHLITLPLTGASQNKLINEIDISDAERNKRKFLQTIQMAYKKAPFFEEVYGLLESIMGNPEENIAKFNFYSFQKVATYLGMNTKLVVSSEIVKDNSLKGDNKISSMCQLLGATHYINPIGGIEIYHDEKFTSHNIDLSFIKTDFSRIAYKQFKNEFVQGLSIIDILMFNSVEEAKQILNHYNLIKKDTLESQH